VAVERRQRVADRQADLACLAAHGERRRERLQQLVAEAARVIVAVQVGGHHDELVAAEAPHRLQQFVAGVVTEPVVDGLEAIEVEQVHTEQTRPVGSPQCVFQFELQAAPVGQPGQRVGVGQRPQGLALAVGPFGRLAQLFLVRRQHPQQQLVAQPWLDGQRRGMGARLQRPRAIGLGVAESQGLQHPIAGHGTAPGSLRAPTYDELVSITLEGCLVVAISSRALFDFEEENRVFEASDDRAYMQLQLQRLDQPAPPGVAFSLVNKLLAFNAQRPDGLHRVEVVILSRNDPVSGMRVFRSAQHYGLPIQRGVFTRGQNPWRYLKPLAAHLFLSANETDVRSALDAGVPAARVVPHSARASDLHPAEVRIAFDGDAVLFSDEAERVYQRDGLVAFQDHERKHSSTPLAPGPFKPLLEALHRLQREPAHDMRIRTALVTARSAPAHERAIRTLMDWHIEVDEAMFLGGLSKGEFLREFEPDFFFDDQTRHVESASAHVPAGHVAAGIVNG